MACSERALAACNIIHKESILQTVMNCIVNFVPNLEARDLYDLADFIFEKASEHRNDPEGYHKDLVKAVPSLTRDLTDTAHNSILKMGRTNLDLCFSSKPDSRRRVGTKKRVFDRYEAEPLIKRSPDNDVLNRSVRHMDDQNMYEIAQLSHAGVLSATEQNELNPAEVDENIEELDIELKTETPKFLSSKAAAAGNQSPTRIVAAPDGSMNRSAMAMKEKEKERREIKNMQQRELLDKAAPNKGLGKIWDDPNQTGDKYLADELRSLAAGMVANSGFKRDFEDQNITFGIVPKGSIRDQRESLPIYNYKDQLINAINENQCLVVVGETGSGKTTQMTQYLAEAGYASKGIIGCTQPRRVAAMSIAKRVAEEVGCRLGEEVGYTIRFEDKTSDATRIKYMTDGMLLRERLLDDELSKYSVVMLDEAHERTVHTDVLMGLLKKLLTKRKDLKVIVTSATLDAEKFARFFFNCGIFKLKGRTFPVEVMYSKEPEEDYLEAALNTVLTIHVSEPAGDILVFLTGQEEIDTACEALWQRMKKIGKDAPKLIILPVYGALPSEMQSRIFEPAPKGARKVVIATNIAEASLTIDGIYYVVDPGFCKQKVYNPKVGMDSLQVVPTSQASADQRKGRAGRTGPGKCFRLYTEKAFHNEMMPNSIPELQRTNLSNVVLQLKRMGVNDVARFPFLDAPPLDVLVNAEQQLYYLEALDDYGHLTEVGYKMAEFPLDPSLSKMLLASVELHCAVEALTIAAMLSVENVFYRPKDKQSKADQKKARFLQPEGDHVTLLAVFDEWRQNAVNDQWCRLNFIDHRRMKRAADIRGQLERILKNKKLPIESCGKKINEVRKAITAGYFTHAAKRDASDGYKTLREGTTVYIHPSSALFQKNPEMVLYHELVLTSKEYMRHVMAIDAKWLIELAPRFYKKADEGTVSKRKQKEKIQPLFDRFAPADIWRLSRRLG
eukprot:TRINITY_DN774149_c0_g1_i1.p1 TRINITY_DN774149_c0_g1~~TRINITY_DN774149_c0_g1_i1.p1  ORF type:complete len:956 (+),score=233.86 TRINITY_DN774149_c0_g1_i1:110-2977(+)